MYDVHNVSWRGGDVNAPVALPAFHGPDKLMCYVLNFKVCTTMERDPAKESPSNLTSFNS